MSKEVELQRFRQLIARSAKTGENLGAELQEQRRRLETRGATAGEINEAIHNRHARGEYSPRYALHDTALKVPFEDKDKAKLWGVPDGMSRGGFGLRQLTLINSRAGCPDIGVLPPVISKTQCRLVGRWH